MSTERPTISIVIPTRDRPEFLARCLESLIRQTTDDFEVIVCDNPVQAPAREVFEAAASDRFRYVRPDHPLAMHDNWEFACAQASGEYVSVMTDKMLLYPNAVQDLKISIANEPVDIISWWGEAYTLFDEATSIDVGTYTPSFQSCDPERFDPMEELKFRCSMSVPRADHGVRYFRGKICFGAFSADLVKRIRSRAGRVFFPLAPDYTSMILAALEARSAIDLGRAEVLSVNSVVSNGWQCTVFPSSALQFVRSGLGGSNAEDRLPIPGLYSAVHNVVAYNFTGGVPLRLRTVLPTVDQANLVRRAREDMRSVRWPDEAEREQQYRILEEAEAGLGVVPLPPAPPPSPPRISRARRLRNALAEQVARRPRFDRVVLRILRRPERQPAYEVPRFESAAEAIKAAQAGVVPEPENETAPSL